MFRGNALPPSSGSESACHLLHAYAIQKVILLTFTVQDHFIVVEMNQEKHELPTFLSGHTLTQPPVLIECFKLKFESLQGCCYTPCLILASDIYCYNAYNISAIWRPY